MITLDFPPPYANSQLHLGHFYEACLIYVFYKLNDQKTREKFFSSQWGFKDLDLKLLLGVDVNGLPIVRTAKKNNPVDLEKECKRIEEVNTQNIKKWYEKLGLFSLRNVEFYKTNDSSFEQLKTKILEVLKKKKIICKKLMPHRYCTNCKEFVSKSETEQVELEGKSYIMEGNVEGVNYKVMTTRPQMIFGALAVVYNPEDPRYNHLKGKKISFNVNDTWIEVPLLTSKLVHPSVGTGLCYVSAWDSEFDIKLVQDLGLKPLKYLYNEKGQEPEHIVNKGGYSHILSFFEGTPIQTKRSLHTERSDCRGEIKFIHSEQIVLVPQDLLNFLQTRKFSEKSAYNQCLKNAQSFSNWCISRGKDYYSLKGELEGREFKLDTWFLSSLTHLKGKGEVWRFQGSDIIRTWGLYSLYMNKLVDFVDLSKIFVHKMILDQKGEKISKSKGNSSPLQFILDQCPLKYLRMYFCSKPINQNFNCALKEVEDLKKMDIKFQNLKIKIKKEENNGFNPLIDELIKDYYLKIDKFAKQESVNFIFSKFLNHTKVFIYKISRLMNKISQKEQLEKIFKFIDGFFSVFE